MPVYLLNELVKQTPEGVYLTSVKQGGQQVAITGVAQTNERISEFLRNTANNSPWLEKPQLVEIQAQTMQVAGSRDQRRMFAFIMGVTLKRPPAPGSAASAASGAGVGSGAAAGAPGFGRFDGDEVSMATQAKDRGADFLAAMRGGLGQFRDLNPNQPGQWPLLPRLTVWALVAVVVVVVGWFVVLSAQADDLQAARDKEPALKNEYRTKLAQAINLDALKKQKEEVQTYVTQLEKQLPGKAEMDALLTDINQAGVGRGLVIDQFIPGQTETKEYYAELPIAIRVTGRFHDIGAFAADIAALSRIVTLHNLSISPDAKSAGGGTLSMEATGAHLSLPGSGRSRRGAQAASGAGGAKK